MPGEWLLRQHRHNADVDREPVAAVLHEIRAAALEWRGRPAIVDLARSIVRLLTELSEPKFGSDERILRAVRYINAKLSASLSLKQLAGVVPSRYGIFSG